MVELKEVVGSCLLPLQVSVGIWQTMKATTPWAVMHCTLAYILNCFYFPYTKYKQLEGFKVRVFKRAISHATAAGEVSKLKNPKKSNNPDEMTEKSETVSVVYLGQKFVLERKEGDKILLKDGPTYYITEKMWETVQYIAKVASETVFVKNHKEILGKVITGDIMEFEEVLDAVILDNRAVIRLDHDYFLPVNLLLTEDKLLKTLNLMGLFVQTQKHIHWLIPAILSFTLELMVSSKKLRFCIDILINTILCRAVQFQYDVLPLAWRRRAYPWMEFIDNLMPSNDLQSKIVKGNISVLVAGSAKFHRQFLAGSIFTDRLVDEICCGGGPFLLKCDSKSDSFSDSVYIEWIFDDAYEKCSLKAGRVASKEARPSSKAGDTYTVCVDGDCKDDTSKACEAPNSLMADDIHTASVDIDCTREEARKLFIFASYMAELRSGSLKSYNRNSNTVHVRSFVESITAYVRSGYPPVYKLDLQDVVVR